MALAKSFVVPSGRALVKTLDLSALSQTGFSLFRWVKKDSGVSYRNSLVDSGINIWMRMLSNVDEEWVMVRDISGNQVGFAISATSYANASGQGNGLGWSCVFDIWDDPNDIVKAIVNDGTPGTAASGANMNLSSSMVLAIGRDYEGTYSTGQVKQGPWGLVKRALTGAEITSIKNGNDPVALLGSALASYVFDDYTNSYVGGHNYAVEGSGSAVTEDTNDFPSVADPAAPPANEPGTVVICGDF